MIPLLDVILDEWVRPRSPDSPSSPVTWVEYCCKVLAATPPWQRGHWVMGTRSYLAIQAEIAVSSAYRFDPSSSDSMPMLLGLPIVIMGRGQPPARRIRSVSIAFDPVDPEDDPLRLLVVRDRWTRPEPGTVEVDPHAGIVRIWLREGECIIPRGAITVEDMTLITEMARRGALGPPAVPLRNDNAFQVTAGAVTVSTA